MGVLPLATLVLLSSACYRKHAVAVAQIQPPQEVRASDLSSDEQGALACALAVGREHDLVKSAVPVSVLKGPLFHWLAAYRHAVG